MLIILSLISIIAISVAIHCATKRKEIDKATEIANKRIALENKELNIKNSELKKEFAEQQKEIDIALAEFFQEEENFNKLISTKQDLLNSIQGNIKRTLENQKELSDQAFQSWWELLEKKYKEKEKEYQVLSDNLKNAYTERQLSLLKEVDIISQELSKIRATRNAAIAAQKKEKEIREKLSFYCLSIKEKDLDDIKKLEKVKEELHSPRILSMLIWSTYFQKPMTALCNNILGMTPVIGIYKITNQKTNECYIGQASRSVADRWKQHAKCGLGIDPPPANKLYKAMQEDGIWNFSWELLEECPQKELNEKERYYIDLYQSYNYGYNSNSGIKK